MGRFSDDRGLEEAERFGICSFAEGWIAEPFDIFVCDNPLDLVEGWVAVLDGTDMVPEASLSEVCLGLEVSMVVLCGNVSKTKFALRV